MKARLSLFSAMLLVVSLFLIAGLAVPVRAQDDGPVEEPIAAEAVIPIDGLETPNNPDVAWNALNTCRKFLVVYDRKRTDTDYNIWGRYVANNGAVVGAGPFQITPNTATTKQMTPAVTYNVGGGNYLVAWEDNRHGQWEIYAQLWNCAKQSVNAAVRITTNASHQLSPDVACGKSPTGCWVVWEDFRNGQWEIYGQRLTVAGALAGGNVRLTNNASIQRYPTITRNPEDTGCALESFMVAWQDSRNSANTGTDIYIQQLDNLGALCGGNMAVTTNKGNQMYPDLAYGTTNNAYQVVWQDHRNGNADIYARRVNPAGAGIGGDFWLSNLAPSSQSRPAVCYGSTPNRFNAVWYDMRAGNLDVYGQRSGGAGGLVGGNIPIANSANNETRPAIAYSSVANIFFVVWTDAVDGIEGVAVAP